MRVRVLPILNLDKGLSMITKKIMQERAKKLRKHNTDVESLLWYFLRNRNLNGYKFKRQVIITPYIVDFICQHKNLIIEIDGSQHFDNKDYDDARTEFLKSKGYRVIRFWNNEILENIENVLTKILDTLTC